ncbi:MAG: hypothetical protein ACP5VS_02050 [Desulfomonilaceae bacterium]
MKRSDVTLLLCLLFLWLFIIAFPHKHGLELNFLIAPFFISLTEIGSDESEWISSVSRVNYSVGKVSDAVVKFPSRIPSIHFLGPIFDFKSGVTCEVFHDSYGDFAPVKLG